MKVKFNGKIYIKFGRDMKGLGAFCFDVFKYYIDLNPNVNFYKLKDIFNSIHCNNNKIIQNGKEFYNLTINQKKRYFQPIKYQDMDLYFSTQWGNNGYENGLECDNINHMIEFAREQGYDIEVIEDVKENLNNNLNNRTIIKNIILYGLPGIGKTYNYKNLISMIEKGKNEREVFDAISKNENILQNDIDMPNERVKFITFHQSYSYEDFIEGFRPQEDGSIQLKDGIFKEFCSQAQKDNTQNYYLVIDEINRGNISKIFGELITLIEEDKRDNLEVVLPYSKKPFKIPSNLYIIATMNSTDKSIATIDIALRRRFTFIKMKPNPNLVNYLNAREFMQKLNNYIKDTLGEDYLIGHSYFMNIQDEDGLEFVKEYKIKPLLEEYFYADDKSVDDILDEIENKGRLSER